MVTDSVGVELTQHNLYFSEVLLVLLISNQIWELVITTSTIPAISAAVDKEWNVSSIPIRTLKLPLPRSLMILKQLILLSISEIDHLCLIPTTTEFKLASFIFWTIAMDFMLSPSVTLQPSFHTARAWLDMELRLNDVTILVKTIQLLMPTA